MGGLLGQWALGLDATERGVAKGGVSLFVDFIYILFYKFEAFHIITEINLLKLKRKIFYYIFEIKSPKYSPYPRYISKIWPILAGSAILYSPMGWIENNTEVQTRRRHLPLPPPHTHTMRMSISPLPQYRLGNVGRGEGEDAILLEI